MKRLYIALTIFCMCYSLQPEVRAAGYSGHDQLLQRAEQLLCNYKDNEALKVYEEVLRISSDNYEALCKASLLHCRIGDRYADETSKIKHFSQAVNYAQRAYTINPSDAESNYVMALSKTCSAMVSGPKKRLTAIHEVKPYLDAALNYDTHHDGAWYMLGRWYYKMANLNFAEQLAAKVFFGGVEEIPTNQNAVEALRNAINYNPENIRYYYDLASIYGDMKDTLSCVSVLNQALNLNPVNLDTKDQLELSRRCNIMLQDLTKR